MTQYTPAPDSLAARVINKLTVTGGTLTPTQIAEQFAVKRDSVSNVLKAAVQAGALQHYSGGRGKTVYHLVGTVPAFDGATTTPSPAPKKRKAKKKPASAPRTARKAREAAPEAAAVPAPIASLWDDGDLVLQGITVNTDGSSVTLTDLQARQVHRFMERIYGPNE